MFDEWNGMDGSMKFELKLNDDLKWWLLLFLLLLFYTEWPLVSGVKNWELDHFEMGSFEINTSKLPCFLFSKSSSLLRALHLNIIVVDDTLIYISRSRDSWLCLFRFGILLRFFCWCLLSSVVSRCKWSSSRVHCLWRPKAIEFSPENNGNHHHYHPDLHYDVDDDDDQIFDYRSL